MNSPREANRLHWLQLIGASYAVQHPFEEPPFFSQARELDRLEAQEHLTQIEERRRRHLRKQRKRGAVADPGETWEGYLASRAVPIVSPRRGEGSSPLRIRR